MVNRITTVTSECPHCQRHWNERVEIKDDNPEDAGKGSVTCPYCGHTEPEMSFVEYDDDVWRVSGANPEFP